LLSQVSKTSSCILTILCATNSSIMLIHLFFPQI
jgi:hypothetical protein